MDLIFTIADPFSPAYRRVNMYYVFCGIASFVLVMIIAMASLKNEGSCIEKTGTSSFAQIQDVANIILAITLSLYIVVAIYSVVYSYRRLSRPGVSKEVRHLFVKKHLVYVVAFIILWMVQQSANYYWLFNPEVTPEDSDASQRLTWTRVPPMHRIGRALGFR